MTRDLITEESRILWGVGGIYAEHLYENYIELLKRTNHVSLKSEVIEHTLKFLDNMSNSGYFYSTVVGYDAVNYGVPFDYRIFYIINMSHAKYNIDISNLLRNTTYPEFSDREYLLGWNLLNARLIESTPYEPMGFPYFVIPLPYKVLSDSELAKLDEQHKFIYYIYVGDMIWSNLIIASAKKYLPPVGTFTWVGELGGRELSNLYTDYIMNRDNADIESKLMVAAIFKSTAEKVSQTLSSLYFVDERYRTKGFINFIGKYRELLLAEVDRIISNL